MNGREKQRDREDDVEGFEYGPIKVVRRGKQVAISSNWSTDGYAAFMEHLRSQRPTIHRTVDEAIQRLLEVFRQYDPLTILSSVAKCTLLRNPETYKESSEMKTEAAVEFMMSLALSQECPSSPKAPDAAVVDVVLRLWETIRKNMLIFFGSEFAEGASQRIESDLRFRLLLRYLFVRGDAHASHLEDTFIDLFANHDERLRRTLGFSSQDLLSFFHRASLKINEATNGEIQRYLGPFWRAWERFREWSGRPGLKADSMDDLIRQFKKENPDVAFDEEPVATYLATFGSCEVFAVKPETDVDVTILERLSCRFGENADFLHKTPKWRGWPTNDSIIYGRPIIRLNTQFYLFHPALLFRNCTSIVEGLLKDHDPRYYVRHYLPARDKYVERTATRLLRNLLPGASIHNNVFYPIDKHRSAEVDAILAYDDCLLILEAKAGRLPREVRRGSIAGLIHNLDDILSVAYQQASRTLTYIKSAPTAPFVDDRGHRVLSLQRERFQHIFLVLVNFEPLYEIGGHLSSARRLGLLPGKEWPWFVYLNDLRVIAEVLEHPTTFIHYLQRRVALNEHGRVLAHDELDLFMNYIKTTLFFSQDELARWDLISIGTYTDELDAYYSWRQGERSEAPKPRIAMSSTFELLLSRLESLQPPHFASACLSLLDCDGETRMQIARQIENCEERFKKDKKIHSAFLRVEKTGFLLGCIARIGQYGQFIRSWTAKWLAQMEVNLVTVICWVPPLARGDFRTVVLRCGAIPSTGYMVLGEKNQSSRLC